MSYGRNIYNLNGRSIFFLHKILGPFFCNSMTHRESASLRSHQNPSFSVFQAGLPDDARVLHHRDVLSPDGPCCGGMELIASHRLKTKGNRSSPTSAGRLPHNTSAEDKGLATPHTGTELDP